MIRTRCVCGHELDEREERLRDEVPACWSRVVSCEACGRDAIFVAAEPLPPGSGTGDFDTRLTVIAAPAESDVKVGTQFFPGGVPDLVIGKLPNCHLRLPGQRVSRSHARLLRADFGPGRWYLENTRSTHGVYVNGQPCDAHELVDGDVIRLGEFQLMFNVLEPVAV